MTKNPRIVDLSETEPNRRRGGDLRAMLTPATVGSTSGFMGLAIVQPGERIGEHYHPYSEEFVYVVNGALEVDLDGETHELRPDQGLLIPINMRHRFRNVGDVEARMVFHLGPLAPRPSLGHVDTEVTEGAESGPGFITGGPDVSAPDNGQVSERSGAIR
ncbi:MULTISPECIES: cupin domain-containing protein [unclassified Streptomyces]|uniref:cupin domain-containing protein n=1 Tax=unclassified Streptomyces TaxID=2593676 RepID=UPI0036572EEC